MDAAFVARAWAQDTTLRVRPVAPPADLGRDGGRLADADGAVVPASAPDSLFVGRGLGASRTF